MIEPPITSVVFDAGETLLELDLPAIARACDDAVDVPAIRRALGAVRRDMDAFFLPHLEAGRFLSQSEFKAGRGFHLQDLLLDHLGIDPARRQAAAEALRALDRAHVLWTLVPPDALPTLEALRARGLRLAVVSNSDGSIEAKLHQEGIGHVFEHVLDSHVEGVSKPHPELFRRAVERLGVDPARTLYVGDLYSVDVVAARLAGLQGVLIDRAGTYETPRPCPRVRSLADLLLLV